MKNGISNMPVERIEARPAIPGRHDFLSRIWAMQPVMACRPDKAITTQDTAVCKVGKGASKPSATAIFESLRRATRVRATRKIVMVIATVRDLAAPREIAKKMRMALVRASRLSWMCKPQKKEHPMSERKMRRSR